MFHWYVVLRMLEEALTVNVNLSPGQMGLLPVIVVEMTDLLETVTPSDHSLKYPTESTLTL